ncbi:MAG: hypothetical protein ACI81O_000186 [Cyclobacteriaceae bacterium]|jgi:hypothetical protein
MLRNMSDLEGCNILATDGGIGHVNDFYFDDNAWVIRYLVADTGTWLSRKVLVSPISIGHPNWAEKTLPVLLSREQVKNSPEIDTDQPVSRQNEIMQLSYYGYPSYWGGAGLWGVGMYPNLMMSGAGGFASSPQLTTQEQASALKVMHSGNDHHLRSCNEVMTYHIHATDGDIGHVKGMLVDDESWAIRYLIVDTSNWWLGHEILISPEWIKEVSWSDAKVSVNLTRRAVQEAPEYDPSIQVERDQESEIHRHYKRPGYWEDHDAHSNLP